MRCRLEFAQPEAMRCRKKRSDALSVVTKPFRGIGSGVIEIAIRHDGEAYRTVVAFQLG